MDEEYVERVLGLVERIPPGRVMAYGWIAEVAGRGPRSVARVMSTYGAAVPWWRVCTSAGRLPPGLEREARQRLAGEGGVLRGDRVVMVEAGWWPPEAGGAVGSPAGGEGVSGGPAGMTAP